MSNFEIIKEINHRIKLIKYKGKEAILKVDLTEAELSPFNDKTYHDKYNFLPIIYEIVGTNNNKSMIMEKLYPFDYDTSANKIKQLLIDFNKFQTETEVTKIDISMGNIMTRENGDIVLFDLWSWGRTPFFYINDNIESNNQSLKNVLLMYKYQKEIKNYVYDVMDYFKKENFDVGSFGMSYVSLSQYGREGRYSNDYYSPLILSLTYKAIETYKVLKEYLKTIGKTFYSKFSISDPFRDLWDNTLDNFHKVKYMDILKTIVNNPTLELNIQNKMDINQFCKLYNLPNPNIVYYNYIINNK